MKTGMSPRPENPAFPSPTQNAAKPTRIHPVVLSITPSLFCKSRSAASRLCPRPLFHYEPVRVKTFSFLPLLLVLCHCGNPSPPRCLVTPLTSRDPAASLVSEAGVTWAQLSRNPSTTARNRYNTAVARLFDQLRCGHGNWSIRARKLGTHLDPTRPLDLGITLDDIASLTPASRISVQKVGQRHLTPGLGVPVVAWKSTSESDERLFPFAPPQGIPINLTAVLDFSSKTPTWRFLSPSQQTEIEIKGRPEPLAADWSASGALYWKLSDLDDANLTKLFLPSRLTQSAGLFFATPFRSDKIPVVLVHGLNSTPGTFKQLYNHLIGQKWFRENYQVICYSYPTGIGWPYHAAKFRQQLRRARDFAAKQGPLDHWDKMVIIGHSMGGVITRASLVDPGERFYAASYPRPLEQLQVSPSTRQAIASVRLYQPLRSPARAIFMAAPHRGSPLADRSLTHWFGSLVRLPKTLTIDLATATLDEIRRAIQSDGEARPLLTSFGTLNPNYKPYKAINRSPFRPGLVYHSIIGNRGRGDRKGSTDGVVPYWSSHLDGAQSEKMIPAGHRLTNHPKTLAEVSRILILHLKNR